MGKRKRVQKNIKKNQKQKMNKTDESSNLPTEVQTKVKEASIVDLPPEVLTVIFKCLNVRALFNCRLVNLQWNAISSGILCLRPKTTICFDYYSNGVFLADLLNEKGKSLSNFVKLFKDCENCPFARFYFRASNSTTGVLNEDDFNKFISAFGKPNQNKTQNLNEDENQNPKEKEIIRIKYLEFEFDTPWSETYFQTLVEDVKILLVNKIPHLEEFSLSFFRETKSTKLPLFSSVVENEAAAQIPVQLPHLKKLHFGFCVFQKFPEISKDLLNAAVNLKSVDLKFCDVSIPSHVKFLNSLRKPILIKKFKINLTAEFLSLIKEQNLDQNQIPWLLSFEKLELTMDFKMFKRDSNSLSDAADILSSLFEASKNTMRKLEMPPLGFLPGLKLPRFKNLIKLKFAQPQIQNCSFHQIFPTETRILDNFPAVNFLAKYFTLQNWPAGFPQEDSIPCFPNVRTLCMEQHNLVESSISILALMCPNLENLRLGPIGGLKNFLLIGREIWTHMKNLVSLEISVDLHSSENTSAALDSCFTGISVENCQRLFEVKKSEGLLQKWGYKPELLKLDEAAAAKREHPSILDMKDLKKLTVDPFFGWNIQKRKELIDKLTWVSEEYAFKFMPHLKPKE